MKKIQIILGVILLATACNKGTEPMPKTEASSPQNIVSSSEVQPKINISEPSEQTQVTCDAWTIIPRVCVGSITLTSSESDLISMFGKENVRNSNIHIGEGHFEPGTILFSDEPEKSLEILWTESRQVAQINIRGKKSLWHTVHGVTLGTTLKELEKINKLSFTLFGFGWDGSGLIVSWNGGKLFSEFGEYRSAIPRVLSLVLMQPHSDKITREEFYEIVGDKHLSSEHVVLQRENPTVNEIYIDWSN